MTDPSCKSAARLLGAYADGQLDAAKTLELDDHLASCEDCNERIALDRAIRGSLKRTSRVSAPADLKARLLASMAAEGVREAARVKTREEAARGEENPGRGMLRHWRTMLPLASAAALTLAWGFAAKQPVTRGVPDVMQSGFANDDVLRQLVDVHKRPIRPETPDPKEVRAFERDVGVPVRVPHFKGARFVGGRVLNVAGTERAAMLQYEVARANGQMERMSVFVYDPARVHVGTRALAPRAVGTAHVQVGQEGGYSIAVREQGGVAYAVATDLDPDSSARLVAQAEPE